MAKRAMDIGRRDGSGWCVLSPIFLATAIAIKFDSKGAVFFRQERIGRGQKPFTIVKFRTMVADAEERKAEVAHLNAHFGLGDDAHVQDPRRPARHPSRPLPAQVRRSTSSRSSGTCCAAR